DRICRRPCVCVHTVKQQVAETTFSQTADTDTVVRHDTAVGQRRAAAHVQGTTSAAGSRSEQNGTRRIQGQGRQVLYGTAVKNHRAAAQVCVRIDRHRAAGNRQASGKRVGRGQIQSTAIHFRQTAAAGNNVGHI